MSELGLLLFSMACYLKIIMHQEKIQETALVFSVIQVRHKSLVSALRRAQRNRPHTAGILQAPVYCRYAGDSTAPTSLVSHTGSCPKFVREERMDRLCCTTAIFQMTATNAMIGSILKQAPRLYVTGNLEFKKKRDVLRLFFCCCLFYLFFSFLSLAQYCQCEIIASVKYHIDCERFGCNTWLKLHNNQVIQLLALQQVF